MPIEKSLDMI